MSTDDGDGVVEPPPIRRLDERVVNKIAAGEIIVRPANAVKELLENSLDAGATSINVVCKDGGLKLLQITDNGHGIRHEDLGIVCERFTTSKLRDFKDLETIATFGFRGEALSSISYVAHLSIVTKTAAQTCAYRAVYEDGQLVPPAKGRAAAPQPCAGVVGTQITVEDLFYNAPTRRHALAKTTGDEYVRVVSVVSQYAVHNSGVAFACRKQSDARPSVQTSGGAADTLQAIRGVYGVEVARELMALDVPWNEALGFSARGYVSKPNYNTKKMTFVLFINHRLVDSAALRRGVETVYANYLPKHTHPWVYLALTITPQLVDVNVHPAKSQVQFLHQPDIVQSVQQALDALLNCCDSSLSPASSQQRTPYQHQKVRTDHTTQTLDVYRTVSSPVSDPQRPAAAKQHDIDADSADDQAVTGLLGDDTLRSSRKRPRPAPQCFFPDDGDLDDDRILSSLRRCDDSDEDVVEDSAAITVRSDDDNDDSEAVPGSDSGTKRLTSVVQMIEACRSGSSAALQAVTREHTFVGCCDTRYALVQHGTRLLLVHLPSFTEQLFYQAVLARFAALPKIRLEPPYRLVPLLRLALDCEDWQASDDNNGCTPSQRAAELIGQALLSHRDMLDSYFSIQLDHDGLLHALPQLVDGYLPDLTWLPRFLLALYAHVSYDNEYDCIAQLSRQIAYFYRVHGAAYRLPPGDAQMPPAAVELATEPIEEFKWKIEHVVLPLARSRWFYPPKQLVTSGAILEITRLENLYKVFERC